MFNSNKRKMQDPEYYFDAYFSRKNFVHWVHEARINKIISLLPRKGSVLDAGCGSGILLYLLKKTGNYKVFGVDVRKDCVDFASKKCNSKNFYASDLRNFDLKRKFDVVVCSDVIEHFSLSDRKKVLKNLNMHLKNNGRLILTFPSNFYIKIIERFWKRIRHTITPTAIFDDEHIHDAVNEQKLESHLRQMGYRIERQGFCCIWFVKYMVLVKEQ